LNLDNVRPVPMHLPMAMCRGVFPLESCWSTMLGLLLSKSSAISKYSTKIHSMSGV